MGRIILYAAAIASAIVLTTSKASGQQAPSACYVAPNGDDSSIDPHNDTYPLATVEAALELGRSECNPIILLDGEYNERIMIEDSHPPIQTPGEMLIITAQTPYSESNPLDGAFLDTSSAAPISSAGRQAAIAIYDSSYIAIIGLHISDDARVYCDEPAPTYLCNNSAIDIQNLDSGDSPASHHIVIEGNEIFNVIASDVFTLPGPPLTTCTPPQTHCERRYDSVPVVVYSYRDGIASGVPADAEATNHVIIRDNLIRDCDVSSDSNGTPAILITTNVEHVIVEGNTIRDIASTAATSAQGGITVRGEEFGGQSETIEAAARARKVVIRNNLLQRIQGHGLYVQSANNILFERNMIEEVDYGIQVATEHNSAQSGSGASSLTRAHYVWIRNNLFVDNRVYDVDFGELVNTVADWSPVDDIWVTNNSMFTALPTPGTSDFDRYRIIVRRGASGAVLNNLVQITWPTPSNPPGTLAKSDQFILLEEPYGGFDVEIDYNEWRVVNSDDEDKFCTFWFPSIPKHCDNAFDYQTDQQYAHDVHGIVEGDALDVGYQLAENSAARDSGVAVGDGFWEYDGSNFGDYVEQSSYPASFPELDYYGQSRVENGAIDIGMHEYQ